MFENIKKLFGSYQDKLLKQLIEKFNAEHQGKYKIEPKYGFNGCSLNWLAVRPVTYDSETFYFSYGIEPYHGSTSFRIFDELKTAFSFCGEWRVDVCRNLWNADSTNMPLSEYLDHVLPPLLDEWEKVVESIPFRYKGADIHNVNGEIGFMKTDMTVRSAYETCQEDLDSDPEFKDYFHRVIDVKLAYKKAESSLPDSIHLSEDDRIEFWIPDSYHKFKDIINEKLDEDSEYWFKQLNQARESAIDRYNRQSKMDSFITEAERHFRKHK